MDDYKDIIDLPHKQSSTRPHMSNYDRAAQFSPFAALTGYDEAVTETARLTDKKIELDEETKSILNAKLQYAIDFNGDCEITVTYFVPDSRKAGGAYVTYTGTLKKFDEYERKIVFEDKTSILVDDVLDIQGEIFPAVFEY